MEKQETKWIANEFHSGTPMNTIDIPIHPSLLRFFLPYLSVLLKSNTLAAAGNLNPIAQAPAAG